MDLALSAASGSSTMWDGVSIQLSDRVLHLDYENVKDSSARRYQRLARGRGIDLASLGDRLGRVALPRRYLTDDGVEEELVRLCEGAALTVIDSLRAACPDIEENDSVIRKYLDRLVRVTERTGTVFVVIHHEGKAVTTGAPRPGLQRMRGSSAVADAIDCGIAVTYGGDGVFSIEQTKSSWGRPGDGISLHLVDVGEIDPSSELTCGIRLEQVVATASTDQLEASTRRFMTAVIDLLRKAGKPLGSREIRESIKGLRNESKVAAIAILKERGEIVQDDKTQRYLLPMEGRAEK